MTTFGVVVVASDPDWHLATATLASVRLYMPDVPICLIYDGTRDLSRASQVYDLHIIRQADVADRRLRERSFGWALTKMVAWWETPFEMALYLEADTVALGDLRRLIPPGVDVLLAEPEMKWDEQLIDNQYFDPVLASEHLPDFEWRHRIDKFTNLGTFFFRPRCLSLDRYIELLDLQDRTGMFRSGDQGIISVMLLEAADSGAIRLDQRRYQTLAFDHDRATIEQRFAVSPPPGHPWVLHWAGPIKTDAIRSSIHTSFRERYETDAGGSGARVRVRVGDVAFLLGYARHRVSTRLRIAARRVLARAGFTDT